MSRKKDVVDIKVSIEGEDIALREAKVECYDVRGKNLISKYYLVFNASDTSEELSLKPGLYVLSHKVGTEMGERDVDYEVHLVAQPSARLSAPRNPEKYRTFGAIGAGKKPFIIL
jgi:hypothetical protein